MDLPELVLLKLRDIEAEMKAIGFWDDTLDEETTRKEAMAYAKEHGKSPITNMSFERWLQAVFIPNARDAANARSLPRSSSVAAMAVREYDYHSRVPEAQPLLKLLREFDELFERS